MSDIFSWPGLKCQSLRKKTRHRGTGFCITLVSYYYYNERSAFFVSRASRPRVSQPSWPRKQADPRARCSRHARGRRLFPTAESRQGRLIFSKTPHRPKGLWYIGSTQSPGLTPGATIKYLVNHDVTTTCFPNGVMQNPEVLKKR